MRRDDARYDGKFFVCVKTTGIFCLPSCKARLPLIKNVVFLETRQEAGAAGFRGCKRCRAGFFPDVAPEWLGTVMKRMRDEVSRRIRAEELAGETGVDSSTLRRYFKSALRTTPAAYHRMLRLEHARSLLKQGENTLAAAYESGFESVSGFRDAYMKRYGKAPGRIHEN